jgi:hypothetical protein
MPALQSAAEGKPPRIPEGFKTDVDKDGGRN